MQVRPAVAVLKMIWGGMALIWWTSEVLYGQARSMKGIFISPFVETFLI